MSATAAPIARPRPRSSASVRRSGALAPLAQLTAFAGLALYVSGDYARMEIHPPQLRVLGIVTIATLGGGALRLSARAGDGRRASALRVAVVVIISVLALTVAGLPARLLWPGAWRELARWLSHGLGGLVGDTWPYRGADHKVRLVVLLGVPACVVPAAALAFWPGPERARGRRRMAALALLLGLYVTALVNQPTGPWALHGLALLGLLAAWLWLARLARPDTGRALAWLSAAALAGLVLAGLLHVPAPWFDYRTWDAFGSGVAPTSFQWDQLYGPIPWSRSGQTMLEVSAPMAELWKVTTLDRFDGVGFLRSDNPPAAPLGGVRGGVATYQVLGFTVRGLRSRLLAGTGQVLDVEITASEVAHGAQIAPDGTGVLPRAPLQPGDTYTVMAYVPRAGAALLRRAPATVPAAYHPYTVFQLPPTGGRRQQPVNLVTAARPGAGAARSVGPLPSWRSPVPAPALRRIHASPYAGMLRLARRLAAGQTNAYDVAQRIAGFLRRNYAYDERPPVRPYPLPAFLFQDGVGYCQQFSAAMALMLRMDGIPARVAEGFLPGTYDKVRRVYRVTALDAHAWVEVYFPGIGWWTFDPTPPRRAAAAPVSVARLNDVTATLAALGLRGAAGRGLIPTSRRDTAPRPASARHRAGGAGLPFGPIGLGLLAAIGLITAGLVAAGTLRLRRGLRGEGDGAVAELSRALERLGYAARADLTLTQLGRRLETTHGPAAGRYVQRLAQRRYRPAEHAPPPTASDRRALRRALVSYSGSWTKLRALLALPPAISRLHHHRLPTSEWLR